MALASAVIRRLRGQTYVVKRSTHSGEYVNGEWQSSSQTAVFTIYASVQPMSGEELERLPEGFRSREARALWTETEMRTVIEPLGRHADRVTIDGEEWEVGSVERWPDPIKHFRCVILRVNRHNGGTT